MVKSRVVKLEGRRNFVSSTCVEIRDEILGSSLFSAVLKGGGLSSSRDELLYSIVGESNVAAKLCRRRMTQSKVGVAKRTMPAACRLLN